MNNSTTKDQNLSDALAVTEEQLQAIAEAIPQDGFTSSGHLFDDITNPA